MSTMETQFPDLLIEFETNDPATVEALQNTFDQDEVLRSSGFDGTILISILPSAILALRMAFKFYEKYKDSLKAARISIEGKKVTLEGFSAAEINEMAEKGTIEKIQEKLT